MNMYINVLCTGSRCNDMKCISTCTTPALRTRIEKQNEKWQSQEYTCIRIFFPAIFCFVFLLRVDLLVSVTPLPDGCLVP